MTLHQLRIRSLDKSFINKAHCHNTEAHGKANILHLHMHPLWGLPLRTFLMEPHVNSVIAPLWLQKGNTVKFSLHKEVNTHLT